MVMKSKDNELESCIEFKQLLSLLSRNDVEFLKKVLRYSVYLEKATPRPG